MQGIAAVLLNTQLHNYPCQGKHFEGFPYMLSSKVIRFRSGRYKGKYHLIFNKWSKKENAIED